MSVIDWSTAFVTKEFYIFSGLTQLTNIDRNLKILGLFHWELSFAGFIEVKTEKKTIIYLRVYCIMGNEVEFKYYVLIEKM